MTHRSARLVAAAPLLVSGLVLAGCMSSPTYGTGTPADEQLLSDVTGILSITPSNKQKEPIVYKPRPDLVKPAPGETAALPPPQENIVTASSEAWPESPEQRRKRLRDDATANQDQSRLRIVDRQRRRAQGRRRLTSGARFRERGNFEIEDPSRAREAFNKRLAETKQGNPTSRKYLSEPPLDYRVPTETAPTGDVGEDEWKKDRRQKRAAKKSSSWRDMLPF